VNICIIISLERSHVRTNFEQLTKIIGKSEGKRSALPIVLIYTIKTNPGRKALEDEKSNT
jgi:hypothetical protein